METFKNRLNKIISFALVVGITLLISCRTNTEQPIAGVYVNSAGSEASIANDTLRVEPDHGQHYKIYRSTGFRLIDESGKQGEWQHETEIWSAVYDLESGVMNESRNGKVITFDREKQVMTVGKRKYKRIEND